MKLYVDTLGSLGLRRAGCPFVAGPLALEHSSKYALARWLMYVIVRNALIFHTVVPHATVMPSPWAPRGTSRAAGSGKADAPVRSANEQARRRAPWTRRDENPTDLGEGYPMPKLDPHVRNPLFAYDDMHETSSPSQTHDQCMTFAQIRCLF